MDTRDFNALVASLPVITKVIGTNADGSPIKVAVRSMFGVSE